MEAVDALLPPTSLAAAPSRTRRRRGGIEVLDPAAAGAEGGRVLADLQDVSSEAFGRDMASYWARRGTPFLESVDAIAIARDPDGRALAFTAWRAGRFAGEDWVYFDATATRPGRQGSGLVAQLQARAIAPRLLRRPWRPVHHVIRTRSPVAWRLSHRTFGAGRAWPDPDGAPTPDGVRALGLAVATWLGQERLLDPATLRLRDAYAGLEGLYGEAQLPRTGDPRFDGFVDEQLGPDDGLLVIGRATAAHLTGRLLPTQRR